MLLWSKVIIGSLIECCISADAIVAFRISIGDVPYYRLCEYRVKVNEMLPHVLLINE